MTTIYWSATTNGFHSDHIDGPRTLHIADPDWKPSSSGDDTPPPTIEVKNPQSTLPEDAVPIEERERERLLAGQANGLIITSDENGYPTLVEPPPTPLETLAAQKRHELDQARDAAFAKGLEYDFDGEVDVVQTRPQDQINLLGLSAKAQRLIAAGQPDATLTFRGGDNVNRELTATEIDALTLGALGYIESIYAHSWTLKDQLDAAEESADHDAIKALRW